MTQLQTSAYMYKQQQIKEENNIFKQVKHNLITWNMFNFYNIQYFTIILLQEL